MFFEKSLCPKCDSKIKEKYDFCPYCGYDVRNPEKDARDFGMLGKNEVFAGPMVGGGGFGITDKILNSLVNSLMKNLEKASQVDSQVESTGSGIKISFGQPQERKPAKRVRKGVTEEQIKRMTGMPRVEAKSHVRRLADKVVYELKATGINSVDDVFVSKLAEGYEVKAIGEKKVYVNSLPVELPLKGYSVSDKTLILEFGLE